MGEYSETIERKSGGEYEVGNPSGPTRVIVEARIGANVTPGTTVGLTCYRMYEPEPVARPGYRVPMPGGPDADIGGPVKAGENFAVEFVLPIGAIWQPTVTVTGSAEVKIYSRYL